MQASYRGPWRGCGACAPGPSWLKLLPRWSLLTSRTFTERVLVKGQMRVRGALASDWLSGARKAGLISASPALEKPALV